MSIRKKLVVTGAGGFLGSHLLARVKDAGEYSVVALSSRPEELRGQLGGANIKYRAKDDIFGSAAAEFLRGAQVVNCAYPRNTSGAAIADGLAYVRRVFDAAAENHAALRKCGAEITGPEGVTMRIGADFPAEWALDGAEALAEEYPAQFLKKHDGEPCVVKLKHAILPGRRFRGRIVVLRNASEKTLAELLAEPELARRLRGALREKHAMCVLHTPEERLDATVPDIVMALDASYHHPTFYHGAVGYHAPFLGWRGWYAPTLLRAEVCG